ncbi:hypothetical protein E2C01_024666 [Portunus trituberculatus]|uniref:Uncharacterized protein n=1 Tax=Portunus trituberculatus TaxID=210409 RepID=A0A5B7EDG2_PORTR|nr:hypothetical protein [Portunus trituberculatus]
MKIQRFDRRALVPCREGLLNSFGHNEANGEVGQVDVVAVEGRYTHASRMTMPAPPLVSRYSTPPHHPLRPFPTTYFLDPSPLASLSPPAPLPAPPPLLSSSHSSPSTSAVPEPSTTSSLAFPAPPPVSTPPAALHPTLASGTKKVTILRLTPIEHNESCSFGAKHQRSFYGTTPLIFSPFPILDPHLAYLLERRVRSAREDIDTDTHPQVAGVARSPHLRSHLLSCPATGVSRDP